MLLRPAAVALLLLVASVPAGLALVPSTGGGGASFATPTYSAVVTWPSVVTSLSEGGSVFSASLAHAGRTATMEQVLFVGDVFLQDLVEDRFFVIPTQSTTANGDAVLTLEVSRTPVSNGVGEVFGEVRLTFLPDTILHDYEFHLPNAAFVPSVFSTTTVAWSAPFAAQGSVLPSGAVVSDDGSALDPYGEWEVVETYGVFQDAPDTLVAHARLTQGEMANYLAEGSMRVTSTTSTVRTVFTGFLDSPTTGLQDGLYARDAIHFAGAAATPADLGGKLDELAEGGSTGGGPVLFDPASVDIATPTGPIPHVLVGVPDSGINPYHEIYYRPNLTVHPCTYLEDFPCDIPPLNFSVGVYDDWETAYAADEAIWDSIQVGKWYWIPKTLFVAVMCEGSTNAAGQAEGALGTVDECLIDDSSDHGTGTTSSVVTENPNVLLAFKEGNSNTAVFEDGTLPIDILSYSWGAAVPLALFGVASEPRDYGAFYVAASGNEGAFPVILDSPKASQAVINVGAADASTRSEPGYSGWKTMDFVSQYCRPGAATRSITGYAPSYCGTSFSAPTFAGALSKIVLELRRGSGYTGSVQDGMVDPLLGVSKWDVREALNLTATYAPEARFPAQGGGVPLVEAAPAYQWGWGYVDSTVVDEALLCIRESACPGKDDVTTATMGALWTYRDVAAGWTFADAMNCTLSADEVACARLPTGLRDALPRLG